MTQADEGRIGSLLDEVAELHHCVYRITDGVDDDYASWYADWLLNLSELPDLLRSRPVRSHLVHELVLLDRDLTFDGSDEPWPVFNEHRLPQRLDSYGRTHMSGIRGRWQLRLLSRGPLG